MSPSPHSHPSEETFHSWLGSKACNFVRAIGWFFVVLSGLLAIHGAYDEQRGVAAPPIVPGGNATVQAVSREVDPTLFRALMNYEWACPVVFFLGGLALHGIVRRADRLDPFSRHFQGQRALEECEKELDAELRRFHSPLRD